MIKEYRINFGFKLFFILLGLIALPIFLMGILVLMIAFKAYVKIDEEQIIFWWLGTKNILWAEVKNISRNDNGNLLVSIMHSLRIETTDGKIVNFPAGCFVHKTEILVKMEEKTGLTIA